MFIIFFGMSMIFFSSFEMLLLHTFFLVFVPHSSVMLVYNAIWNVLYTLIKISDFPIVLCVFKYICGKMADGGVREDAGFLK